MINDPTKWTLGQRMVKISELVFMAARGTVQWAKDDPIGENVLMAVALSGVLPLLGIYIFTQRYFTQSIDRTGLVE